ncbi:unnamed protein product [Strongylus vulgaris]|uniref:Uncharacterized protein n=1 Tax=Strongylus vulgaris TaxID=40348 RepID=A0A3P7KCF5_STRVU|nr:unnamed protein product [Strongylus vulgaris]
MAKAKCTCSMAAKAIPHKNCTLGIVFSLLALTIVVAVEERFEVTAATGSSEADDVLLIAESRNRTSKSRTS